MHAFRENRLVLKLNKFFVFVAADQTFELKFTSWVKENKKPKILYAKYRKETTCVVQTHQDQ